MSNSKLPVLINDLSKRRPIWTPQSAYDIPFLFQEEIDEVLKNLTVILDMSIEDLLVSSYALFEEKKGLDCFWASLIIYVNILNQFSCKDIKSLNYDLKLGYIGIIGSRGISLLQELVIISMKDRSIAYLKERDSRLALFIGRHLDTSFLFQPFSMSKEYLLLDDEDDDDSNDEILGALYYLVDELLETNDNLKSLARVIRNNTKSEYTQSKRISKVTEEEIEEEKPKKVLSSIDLITENLLKSKPNYTPKFSSYWMAPPPISPLDIYNLDILDPLEVALVLDSFLDIYETQMLLLSLYFLLRRNLSLWEPTGQSSISLAVFSGEEILFIQHCFENISGKISTCFSVKFLALEGISLGGKKLLETLGNLQKATIDSPIVDIKKILESQISLIRDSCIALDRLRCSILYGKFHPSYVGDQFLASYISLFYKLYHAESSFDNILSLLNPISAITLPKDEEDTDEFLEHFCEGVRKETLRQNLKESSGRKHYIDSSSVAHKMSIELGSVKERKSIPVEGIIESEILGNNISKLFNIYERMWG